MKNDKALKVLTPLAAKLDKDGDTYLFVHFSREDDHFKGLDSSNMDFADALIIIKHLVNKFGIDKKVLCEMLK